MLAFGWVSLPLYFPVFPLELHFWTIIHHLRPGFQWLPITYRIGCKSLHLSPASVRALIQIYRLMFILPLNISTLRNMTTYLSVPSLGCLQASQTRCATSCLTRLRKWRLHPSSCWGQGLAVILYAHFPTAPRPNHRYPPKYIKNLITWLPSRTTFHLLRGLQADLQTIALWGAISRAQSE